MDNNTSLNRTEYSNDQSSDDDALSIVIESPSGKKKSRKSRRLNLNASETKLVEEMEGKLEQLLDEKASKVNLTVMNVKNILKEVITNEDFLALVKKLEDPNSSSEPPTFEPKLTRAKAKELKTTSSITSLPWPSSTNASPEVHNLINKELLEDSDDDEYVPGDSCSEDDRDSSLVSESPRSTTPPTPSKNDCSTQTNWTEDGIFKIPPNKTAEEEEAANIALRTRSKLCLSKTPLEAIEEAFIPPDITTDMYDMDCDDEEWGNFLKQYMKPLEEVTKAPEDEDHDPEYNVLADEIDRVDREDFRSDRGVKVTKKELNELISELFEYSQTFEADEQDNQTIVPDNEPQIEILDKTIKITENGEFEKLKETEDNGVRETVIEITVEKEEEEVHVEKKQKNNEEGPKNQEEASLKAVLIPLCMEYDQILLLQQQMRQHVQMLTQNFLLTYQNPEFFQMAVSFKECLLNLKNLTFANKNSAFQATNLDEAVELTSKWEQRFAENSEDGKSIRQHFTRVLHESNVNRIAGTRYVCTFPPQILETVCNSSVFVYPALLPRIPFKSYSHLKGVLEYTAHEDELIALGLEQFYNLLKNDPTYKGPPKLIHMCQYIVKYMLPIKSINGVYQHVKKFKGKNAEPNPISFYFQNNKAPLTYHYVAPLATFGVLPPRMRDKESLPYQWLTYLYPQERLTPKKNTKPASAPIRKVQKPPAYKKFSSRGHLKPKRQLALTGSYIPVCSPTRKNRIDPFYDGIKLVHQSTPKKALFSRLHNSKPNGKTGGSILVSKNIKEIIGPTLSKLKFNSSIFRTIKGEKDDLNMLPNMPNLNTPVKKTLSENIEIGINSSVTETDQVNITVTDKGNNLNSSKNYSEDLEKDKKGTGTTDMSLLNNLLKSVSSATEVKTIADSFNEQNKEESGEKRKNFESDGTSSQEEDSANTDDHAVEKDNIEDINALMAASSTIKNVARKGLSSAQRRRAKIRREHDATLAMLRPENESVLQERAQNYATGYFNKVREKLEVSDYQKFMEILNNFDEENGKVVDLYRSIEELMFPKYQELLDEFLTFLTPSQAAEIGKFIPHLMMNNMSLFLSKLETYFKEQPAQLRKVYKSLMELGSCVDVTMEKIKTTIVPLLKGNTFLTDWFLQLFPSEKPTDSMLEGPFETVDITNEFKEGDQVFETITLPEGEDPYGGPKCICNCHESENILYKTRSRHCIPCGTKFIQGRIYIQTGKGLRVANVTFGGKSGPEHDISLYVSANEKKRRSDSSPSKLISPSKEQRDGGKSHFDSEDEKRQKGSRAPRKRRKAKDTEHEKQTKQKTLNSGRSSGSKTVGQKVSRQRGGGGGSTATVITTTASSIKEQQTNAVNVVAGASVDACLPSTSTTSCNVGERQNVEEEGDIMNTSVESVEQKLSSEHSAESESDLLEESSQDNTNSESEDSAEEGGSVTTTSPVQSDSNTCDDVIWTLNEDRIILETLQKEVNKETAFDKISKLLETRTIPQIKHRFNTLMELLQEMTGAR